MKKLDFVRLREWLVTAGPALLVIVAAFAVTAYFVKPAPPDVVVMSVGGEGGAYWRFAEAYREVLARDHITLDLRTSAGSRENLDRLRDDTADYSVALIQSGVTNPDDAPNLVSLGRMFHEPLWVFHRLPRDPQRLTDLRGKRLAIGAAGSGTRNLALRLLAANNLHGRTTRFVERGGQDAADALRAGDVDAIFLVSAPESELVQALLRDPKVKLMSFAHADAYARQFPFLSRVVLHRGVVDFATDRPRKDIVLLAPAANLVVRDDVHPALVFALAQAAAEVHGGAALLNPPGQFPQIQGTEFPASADAARFYRSGPPFFQRYLPFWIAVLMDRLLVLLVPIVTVLLPLVKIVPLVYAWRIRQRLLHWYGVLKELELSIDADPSQRDAHLAALADIDAAVIRIPIPLTFSDQYYNLRGHIDIVRRKLGRSAGN